MTRQNQQLYVYFKYFWLFEKTLHSVLKLVCRFVGLKAFKWTEIQGQDC